MAEPENLEARVVELEARVEELAGLVRATTQDAAARVLAGGADRDVSEFRGEIRDFRQATTSSFNAMREDLTDLGTTVGDGFTEMRGKFDALATGQQTVVDLLTKLADPDNDQTN
ncbi:permease [Saccharothrix stipae]